VSVTILALVALERGVCDHVGIQHAVTRKTGVTELTSEFLHCQMSFHMLIQGSLANKCPLTFLALEWLCRCKNIIKVKILIML